MLSTTECLAKAAELSLAAEDTPAWMRAELLALAVQWLDLSRVAETQDAYEFERADVK